jgi:hypothetical protein
MMATPLPMVDRLSCKTCDNFQGNPAVLDGATGRAPTGGWPVAGKCRKACPEPTLQDTDDALVANWPTVQQTDVCSFHTDGILSRHPEEAKFEEAEQGDYFAGYVLNPSQRFNTIFGYQDDGTTVKKPSELASLLADVNYDGGRTAQEYRFTISAAAVYYTCETCDFWKQDGAGAGECRLRAPKPISASAAGTKLAIWATTQPNDWCADGVPNPRRVTAVLPTRTNPTRYATPE